MEPLKEVSKDSHLYVELLPFSVVLCACGLYTYYTGYVNLVGGSRCLLVRKISRSIA